MDKGEAKGKNMILIYDLFQNILSATKGKPESQPYFILALLPLSGDKCVWNNHLKYLSNVDLTMDI